MTAAIDTIAESYELPQASGRRCVLPRVPAGKGGPHAEAALAITADLERGQQIASRVRGLGIMTRTIDCAHLIADADGPVQAARSIAIENGRISAVKAGIRRGFAAAGSCPRW